MGVYNAEKTLKAAIQSIVDQTFQNWELIICDDGSTDHSYKIASTFDDSRILIIRNKKNMGLGYALNRCLDLARGSYIARMDADDISMPDRLGVELDFLKLNPEYDIVSTSIIMFDENDEFCAGHCIQEPRAKDFIVGSPVAHPTCMIRKKCLEEVGGYSELKNTLRVEDIDLWIRLLEKGYRFWVLSKPLYRWRFNYDTIKRQKLKYRWNGTVVRLMGCKRLGLPAVYYLLTFKTVLIGFIPPPIRYKLHMRHMKRY